MNASHDTVDPDDGFVPLGVVEVPVLRRPRLDARSAHRVFRGTDGIEVAIPESVIGRLLAFARNAAPNEWLGLVVGQRCEDTRGEHLLVLGLVPDCLARADRGRVETTHASEHETRSLARTLYPDAILLGWVHSHVRCGVTFSSTDRATQATWRERYSLGIVVDPWDPRVLTVYRGPESEALTAIPMKATAPREQPPVAIAPRIEPPTTPAPPRPRRRGLLPLTCLLALGVAFAALQRTHALAARVARLERAGGNRTVTALDAGLSPATPSGRSRAR